MKTGHLVGLALIPLITSLIGIHSAWARDSVQDFSVEEAMSTPQAASKLSEGIKFYFGDTKHAKIERNFGEFGTNKKTNAFNKSDLRACQIAFVSAMIALQNRAQREGGNAVVNIKSNYRGNTTSSDTTFKCGAGNVVAGVALLGTVVKLKK